MRYARPRRRTVIKALLGWALVALAHVEGRATGPALESAPDDRQPSVHPGDGMLEVGAEYLRLQPRETDVATLHERLGLAAGALRAPSAALRRRLWSAHRNDFRLGQTVDIRGWVLSETEARLCGLLYLASTSEAWEVGWLDRRPPQASPAIVGDHPSPRDLFLGSR